MTQSHELTDDEILAVYLSGATSGIVTVIRNVGGTVEMAKTHTSNYVARVMSDPAARAEIIDGTREMLASNPKDWVAREIWL